MIGVQGGDYYAPMKYEDRNDKWLVDQYNRNRLPENWVATIKDIKTNNKYYANRKNKSTKSFR
jgi:hypothetical protein